MRRGDAYATSIHVPSPPRRQGQPGSCPRPSSSVQPAPPSASSAAASPPSTPPSSAASPCRPRSSAPTSAPSRSSTSSSARSSRPARARSPRARRRSRPASRRRSPRRRSTRSARPACARPAMLDSAIRAGDLDVGVAGGMESMSNAPYLLKQARFGFRMGDAKAIDAMINDGLRNPFSGKQMFEEAGEVADELEMTRADLDRWALRSHELRDQGDRRGPPVRRDRPRDGQGPQGRHRRRGRRGAAPRLVARVAVEAQAALEQPGLAHGRQLARASTTAAARSCSPPPTGPRATARRSSPRSSPRRRSPTTSRTSPGRPPRRRRRRSTRPGMTRRRRRPLGDQRGVRVGRGQLGPRPRRRRGQGQRQRRRGRARPPDRRVRRADPRRARPRAAPARRRHRRRGDLQRRRPGRRRPAPRPRRLTPTRGERRAPGDVRRSARRGRLDRGGLLRPRPHAHGGLVGVPLGPRGAARRADQPPPARARRLREPALPPRGLDRRGAPTRSASASGR